MFNHYLKLALRDIFKRRLFSLVIVLSLSTGFACMIYIVAFVDNELSVDKFHKNKNNIYRLQADDPFNPGNKMNYIDKGAPEYMKANFPEIEDYCEISIHTINKIIIAGQKYFDKNFALRASPSFFNIFSYHFIEGSNKTALDSKEKIVISETLAKKYFGNSSALGKEIIFDNGNGDMVFFVSGVIKDLSDHSHLITDMIVPLSVGSYYGGWTYVLLKEGTDIQALEKKFSDSRSDIPVLSDGNPGTHYLQSLSDVYFDTQRTTLFENHRKRSYIFITVLIGLVILVVSLLNYINLASVQWLQKTKPYGIVKLVGGSNKNLMLQLLTEFCILIIISYGTGFVFTQLLSGYFNNLTNSKLDITSFLNPSSVFIHILLFVLITVITGLHVLYNLKHQKVKEILTFTGSPVIKRRKMPALILFQFCVSLVLIVSVIVISTQVSFIHNRDIGMNKDVVELNLPYNQTSLSPIFKEELLKNPLIHNASICESSPVIPNMMVLLHYDKNDDSKTYTPWVFPGDENYMKVSGIKLIEGRYFSGILDKESNKCIINRSLAKKFDMKSPIGQVVPGTEDEIIGLVEDFHCESLEEAISPAYFPLSDRGNTLLVDVDQANRAKAMEVIKAVWQRLLPDQPFEYHTLGELFETKHAETEDFFRFIITFSAVSILLTCLGLFALTSYSLKLRTKEIGIRKVIGSGTFGIFIKISEDYLKWLVVSFVVATPVAYYAMNKWLENFAYKTSLSWWIFALAGILAMGIALLTVSWQSWRAARRNPVEALRYE